MADFLPLFAPLADTDAVVVLTGLSSPVCDFVWKHSSAEMKKGEKMTDRKQ